jgi:sensor histidine kinase regulating citrate/malate metabolism
MLKYEDEHLLLSIRNSYLKAPIFSDGLPVTNKKDHGYGTQSIRYMTERLGGNCMFSIENQQFILRVII